MKVHDTSTMMFCRMIGHGYFRIITAWCTIDWPLVLSDCKVSLRAASAARLVYFAWNVTTVYLLAACIC